MCGIFFYLNKKKDINKKEENKLDSASKVLFHRGPDYQSSIIYKNLYIFHSRLSIQDNNKRSNQPMIKKHKNNKYTIVYNGEIYNFKELKKKIKRNISFKTKSDTEVLLNLFIINQKNLDFISKLEGMFSFIIFNEYKNELFFGRDFFGQKPMYYFDNEEYLIISSEIKPILKFTKKNGSNLNNLALKKYLLKNDYFAGRETLFDNIYQVLPGEIGTIINNQIFLKKIYKKINFNNKSKKNNYFKILKNNILKHLISDKKISLSLSSGIDSSLIAHYIYNSKKKYELQSYTYDYDGESYEYNEASKFANSYNQQTKKIIIDHNYIINNFEKFVISNEGPIGGINQFGLFEVCNQAKQDGYDVVLSGFGLDESLASYKSIKQNLKENEYFKLIDNYMVKNAHFVSENYQEKLQKLIENYFFNIKIPRTTHMVDRSSMHSSVEMRLPFLEKNFVEATVKQIDMNSKIDKIIIRKFLNKNSNYKKDWLQPKIHVPHPQNKWLRYGIFSEWTDYLLKDNFIYKNLEFLDKKEIINSWKKFKNNEIPNGYLFWQIINLYFIKKNFS